MEFYRVQVTQLSGVLSFHPCSEINRKGERGMKEMWIVQSTEQWLIPARYASLAAIQGSASGSNIRYYPT
jgi:hypothetical protein